MKPKEDVLIVSMINDLQKIVHNLIIESILIYIYPVIFGIHMKYIFLLPVDCLNADKEPIVCER